METFACKKYILQVLPVFHSGKVNMKNERGVIVIRPQTMYVGEVNGVQLSGMKSGFLVCGFQMNYTVETVYKFKLSFMSVRNNI